MEERSWVKFRWDRHEKAMLGDDGVGVADGC